MAKKCLLALILAVFITGGAFAVPDLTFSIGAGGYFTSDFGGGVVGISRGRAMETPYFGGGGFIFLDATFAELSLGFFRAGGNVTSEMRYGDINERVRMSWFVEGLDIGLLGKYPFVIDNRLTLFPLLGINYRIIFYSRVDGDSICAPGDFNALWFKFGGGLDFAVNNNIFLRGQALYGFRARNRRERDLVRDDISENARARLGHGLTIKLGVGYRF